MEAVIRELDDSVVFRGTAGVDRLFQVGGRDLILVAEYQRDGLGAATSDEYLDVVFSDPFRRGELQAFGRDETALQLAYQIHPLWNVAGLWLLNLNDRSALLFPSLAYSLSNEASLSGGVSFGLGADESTPHPATAVGARSRRHDGVRVAQLVLLTDRRAHGGLKPCPSTAPRHLAD